MCYLGTVSLWFILPRPLTDCNRRTARGSADGSPVTHRNNWRGCCWFADARPSPPPPWWGGVGLSRGVPWLRLRQLPPGSPCCAGPPPRRACGRWALRGWCAPGVVGGSAHAADSPSRRDWTGRTAPALRKRSTEMTGMVKCSWSLSVNGSGNSWTNNGVLRQVNNK